jgi:intracellular septation protein
MKFLFDFFPVLLFYITYKSHEDPVEGMVTATGVLIMATLFQISYTWLRHRRIEKIHVITMTLLLVLGGATIWFKEPLYLIWKVSIANWLFAIAFAGSHFIGHKPIIKRMMDHAIKLPESVWTRLSLSWIAFFIAVGLLNLYIGTVYDFDTWVDFKFYGLMGMTLAFVLMQAVYIGRHAEELPQQSPEPPGTGDGQ